MKAVEIIKSVQETEPSSYTSQRMLDWLSELDGQIWEAVILTHEGAPEDAFTGHKSLESELLAPWPYGMSLYENYLKAKIAAENAETERYNQCATLYAAALRDYRNWYNRSHRPKGARTLRI
jgi:hypothetical protein